MAGDTPSVFAWQEEKRYPIHDAEHIKIAQAYFENENRKMSIAQKLEFVLNTTRAAEKQMVSLANSALSKFASLDRHNFNREFVNHVAIRQSFLRDGGQDAELKEGYRDLIKKADKLGPTCSAQVLYELDKLAGLDRKYGHGIEDPLLATLAMQKTAAIDVDGTFISLNQLRELSSDDLTEIVGNGVISELKSDEGIDVLRSLPKPVRQGVLDLL